MIIDATNAILGRLSTKAAKALLNKQELTIINAEKVIITGDPVSIKKKYHDRIKRGSPQHGPFFPRSPDRIIRRTIRGMLPKNYKPKLNVFIGIPEGVDVSKAEAETKKIKTNFIKLEELSKSLGWSK